LKYKNRGEFIAALIQDLPEAPQYFKHNAALNTQGPPLVDWDAGLPPAATPNTDLANPEKTYVVDLRNADAYAAGHIPNSVNIALRGRLETWVGTMVPWGTRVVLVGSKKQLKEGLLRLHRIGYTPEIITFEAWRKAGMPVTVSQPITPSALHDMMQNGEAPLIVDVRLPTEWMALKIGTVLNLPLNHLSDLSRKLDPKAPVVVVCNSAYRSSMAVGVLERKGFETVRNLEGGSQAWIDGGFPVFEGTNSGGKVTKAVPKGKTSPGDLKRPARKKIEAAAGNGCRLLSFCANLPVFHTIGWSAKERCLERRLCLNNTVRQNHITLQGLKRRFSWVRCGTHLYQNCGTCENLLGVLRFNSLI
jgi:hydroxyacylglutathione hydrolase